jgi:legumain
LAVITGNSTAVVGGTGRVLNSGPDDMVFLNFVDHGEPGVMDFPP